MEDDEIEEGMLVEEDAAPPPPKKPGKSPYEMLQESKSSVEDTVTKMLTIKKEAKPKSELRELVTHMFLNFVTLRQANRSILLEEDRVKAEMESAKAPSIKKISTWPTVYVPMQVKGLSPGSESLETSLDS